ncbi:DUF4230 domain-containing protein [Pacificimonas sp. ICDLI1SI03]|jgi:hypothetical protein|tara:strand:+ start:52778 stop:53410 length:633 start_codon:yes stop_codon:yes gene_type:complete
MASGGLMRTLFALLIGLVVGAGALWAVLNQEEDAGPDVQSIAAASLEAVRAQNRLTVFAGRFTVAVTSRAERLGLSAEKTMIVPATVRYEIDYAKLTPADVRWDAETSTMQVNLPAVEISAPEVDLTKVREYGEGRMLMTLGNAEQALDSANRRKVGEAVRQEADTPLMLNLARDAARDAVARGFRLPLEAAGVPARVIVRFPDEVGSGS